MLQLICSEKRSLISITKPKFHDIKDITYLLQSCDKRSICCYSSAHDFPFVDISPELLCGVKLSYFILLPTIERNIHQNKI